MPLVYSELNSLLSHALLFTRMPLLVGLLNTKFVLSSLWSFFSLLDSVLNTLNSDHSLLFGLFKTARSLPRNFYITTHTCTYALSLIILIVISLFVLCASHQLLLQGKTMLASAVFPSRTDYAFNQLSLWCCSAEPFLPRTGYVSIGCLSGADLLRTFFQGYTILIGF